MIIQMKRNKLTALIAFVGVVAFTSCEEVKRPTPVRERINVTPPSREAEAISQLTASIDEISANLDAISSQEAMLSKTLSMRIRNRRLFSRLEDSAHCLERSRNRLTNC